MLDENPHFEYEPGFLKDNTLDFIRSSNDSHILRDHSVSDSELTDCLQTQVNWC